MRTTIRLDESLLQQVKETALADGVTMTSLIEHALREALARRAAPAKPRPTLPTFSSPFRPGADLDSNERLLDLMDSGG